MSVAEPPIDDSNSNTYCDTYFDSKRFRYTWKIHDFRRAVFRLDGKELKTPKFETLHNGITISWYLGLLNKYSIYDRCGSYNITLILSRKVSRECEISFKWELSLINKNIKKSIKINGIANGLKKPEEKFVVTPDCGIVETADIIAECSGFCPNNTLTIICDIAFEADQLSVTSNEHDQQVPDCQLIDDVGALFGDKKFCDVTLTVNGKDFYAHKNMLAARSSIFTAMFEHEMAEKISNTVKITDIDHQVFEEVLRYIYTGKTSSLTDEIAMELLVAADKYELDRLKIICEVFMGKNITKNNVTNILIVADAHRSILLKTRAIEFINRNRKDVKDTKGYKSMLKLHPQFIEECYNALAEKFEQIEIK